MSKAKAKNPIRVTDEEFLSNLSLKKWDSIQSAVTEYTGFLLRSALKMGFDEIQAEELAQAVWVTFFDIVPKFEGRSQIKTFLYGILVNKAREQRRSGSRTDVVETIDETVEHLFDADGNWLNLPIDPEDFLNATQTMEIIEKCLEKLPLNQRQAFVLKEIEAEKPESICNILAVSSTNLRVLLSRAKNGLRLCIEKNYTARQTKA